MSEHDTRRARKRRWVNRMHRHVVNPMARRTARWIPGQAVLETTGRVSGRARRTPVGGRLIDHGFWLVSNHGRSAQYVRNIEADPRVRLQIGGCWRSGTARLLDADDADARLRTLPGYNSMLVRALGTDLLTVRIDLDTPGRTPPADETAADPARGR